MQDAAKILSTDKGLDNPIVEEQPLIVIPDGELPSWIQKALEFYGLDEAEDEEILTAFLGFNPNEKTGGDSWCTGFVNKVFEAVGIKGTGSLSSQSFIGWGQECPLIEFALVVFKNKHTGGGHVGFVRKVEGVWKLLGGNQRNMVKYSNLAWYLKQMEMVWCCWPEGYAIPDDVETYEV